MLTRRQPDVQYKAYTVTLSAGARPAYRPDVYCSNSSGPFTFIQPNNQRFIPLIETLPCDISTLICVRLE